jgi:hypothetical protein
MKVATGVVEGRTFQSTVVGNGLWEDVNGFEA